MKSEYKQTGKFLKFRYLEYKRDSSVDCNEYRCRLIGIQPYFHAYFSFLVDCVRVLWLVNMQQGFLYITLKALGSRRTVFYFAS